VPAVANPPARRAARPPLLQRKIDNVDVALAARAHERPEGGAHLARLVQLLLVTALNTPQVADEVTQGIMALPQGAQDSLMALIEDGFADLGVDIEGASGGGGMVTDEPPAAAAAGCAPMPPVDASSLNGAGGMTPSRKRARSGLTPAKLRSLGTPGRGASAAVASSAALFGAAAVAASGIPSGRRSVSAARSHSFDALSSLGSGDGGGSFALVPAAEPFGRPPGGRLSMAPPGAAGGGGIRGGAAAASLERDNAALREEVVSASERVARWRGCCWSALSPQGHGALQSAPAQPQRGNPSSRLAHPGHTTRLAHARLPPPSRAHRRTCAPSWTRQSVPPRRLQRAPLPRGRAATSCSRGAAVASMATTTTTTTAAAAAAPWRRATP